MRNELAINYNIGYYNIFDSLPNSIKISKYAHTIKDHSELQLHGYRVADMSVNIAAHIGLSSKEIEAARISGMLHDIGKLCINPSILNKNGKLTNEEYDLIKTHVIYSEEIMVLKGYPQYAKIVLYHHEKIDGSGYYGLKDNEIPRISKIVALSDIYDALRSNRAYRKAKTKKEALEIIAAEKHKYDDEVYKTFLHLYGK